MRLARSDVERERVALGHRQIAHRHAERASWKAGVALTGPALCTREGGVAFLARREIGRAEIPDAGQIAQRCQHKTDGGERACDGAGAGPGLRAGDDHRAGGEARHGIGQRLERFRPEEAVQGGVDHPLGAFAQLAYLGGAAAHAVKLWRERHAFGHLGGDARAAGAQAAVQRLEPWPGEGQHRPA